MRKNKLTSWGLGQGRSHALKLGGLGTCWRYRLVTKAEAADTGVYDPPCAYLQIWNIGLTIRLCDDGDWFITDPHGGHLAMGTMRPTSRRYADVVQDWRCALAGAPHSPNPGPLESP